MASARTRLYALLGSPVAHSFSPAMQNAAFAAAGLDAVYVALDCDADSLSGLLRGIAGAGGGGNVTVPHKGAAAALVDAPTTAVQRTGACNTFWGEDGRVRGDNTDVEGFAAAAGNVVGDLNGARVLVLGAGGAARAAVCALLDARAAVTVLNRTAERAHALRERLDPAGDKVAVVEWGDGLEGERFDLVVNATSLGMDPRDPLPMRLDELAHAGALLDLVYAPGGTRLVRQAADRGIPAADGTEILLRQGAAAFERWFGREAPVDAMRAALTAGHG